MYCMVGEAVEGVATGVKPYGAFVHLDSKYSGSIHISEISKRSVRDVHTYVKVNEYVKAKILDVDEDDIHFKLPLKVVEANEVRSMRKRRFVHELPQMNIGFTSLVERLGQWIEEVTK